MVAGPVSTATLENGPFLLLPTQVGQRDTTLTLRLRYQMNQAQALGPNGQGKAAAGFQL